MQNLDWRHELDWRQGLRIRRLLRLRLLVEQQEAVAAGAPVPAPTQLFFRGVPIVVDENAPDSGAPYYFINSQELPGA